MGNNIIGVPVMVHDACRGCGGNACFVDRGPAPLYRQLRCDVCETTRGYVSKELRSFLEDFAEQFGWPDQPIVLHTGKVWSPEPREVAAETQPKPKHKRKANTKMKMDQLFPSKYLRSADLDGETRIVVVDRVEYETFKNDGGKQEKKAVLHFRGGTLKPFITNKTNAGVMVELSGSDDADDWGGTRIALSPTVVSFKGKATQSIRVGFAPKEDRSIVTGKAKAKPEAKVEAKPDFDDEVAI